MNQAFMSPWIRQISAALLTIFFAIFAHAGPTTTILTVNINPAGVGQSVTLTATVTGSSPTGTVTFKSGTTSLGTGTLTGSVATFSTSFSSTGTKSLTAAYGGNSGNSASTSSAVSLVVNAKANTTTTLSASPNPSNVGQNVTLTAIVTGNSPTGTVTFKKGTTTLGTGTIASGQATFSTTALTVGANSLTASYAGNSTNNTSTSGTLNQNVKAVTTTTLATTPNPSNPAQSVTLTATIVGGSTPTGTVTFMDGIGTLGTATVSGTTASFSTTALAAGSHSLTAVYGGNTNNNPSTSSAVIQVVKANTTTVLTTSPNSSAVGQSVTFTATISGGISPSGTVTFRDGTTTLGTNTVSGTTATFSSSTLTAGTHSLTAVYAGNTANNGSTSSAVSQVVNTVATTTTAIAASPNPSTTGQSVTLTATIAGGSSPTGTVTFKEGTATLGTGAVSGTTASFSTTTLSLGTHNVTATYGGNGTNTASTSSALNVVVNGVPTALPPVASSPLPIVNYEYDAKGNPTTITQAPGVTNFGFQTINTYDSLSRRKYTTNPTQGTTQFAYDGMDRTTQVTDPRYLVTQYARTGLGDTTQLVSPDTGTANQTYDAAGNLKTRIDSRGALATYTYDALNRPTALVFTQSGQPTQAFGWTYDQTGAGFAYGVGRLTSTSSPTAASQYTYDAQGRLISDIQRVSPATGANVAQISTTVTYAYDGAGHVTSIVYPSGRKLSVGYVDGWIDSMGLAKDTATTATSLISSVTHTPFGAPKSWLWQLASGTQLHERIFDTAGRMVRYRLGSVARDVAYDAADRITNYTHWDATYATAVPALDQSFGYDKSGRLTSTIMATTTLGAVYDDSGNRKFSTVPGIATYYATSATSNQLTTTDNPARSFSYDSAGNTTADTGNAYTSTFDVTGRLATLTKAGTTTTYSYDAKGQRVRKFSSSGVSSTLIFVYDQNGQLLGEYSSLGVPIREYVWLGSTPVAIFTPDPANSANPPLVYYVHTDHLDTPRAVLDKSNNLRWRWMAEPFGTTAPETNPASQGVFTQNLRLPGQYADQESGLSYNYFRDYDSTTGRYIQSDPIGLDGGINTYSYVGGSPLSYTDPNGLAAAGGAIGGAIGGALGSWGGGAVGGALGAAGGTMMAPGVGTVGVGAIGATEGAAIGGILGAGLGAGIGSAVQDLLFPATTAPQPAWKRERAACYITSQALLKACVASCTTRNVQAGCFAAHATRIAACNAKYTGR